MTQALVYFICTAIAAAIFAAVGIAALVRKTPMHFWAGSEVKADKIRDVRAYNRANGILWLVFAGLYILVGLLAFFSISLSGILTAVLTIGGIPVLILIYQRIYTKYRK